MLSGSGVKYMGGMGKIEEPENIKAFCYPCEFRQCGEKNNIQPHLGSQVVLVSLVVLVDK